MWVFKTKFTFRMSKKQTNGKVNIDFLSSLIKSTAKRRKIAETDPLS